MSAERRPDPDRLVAALAVMIQQAALGWLT